MSNFFVGTAAVWVFKKGGHHLAQSLNNKTGKTNELE
jgi:hypothetical protein